MRCRWIIDGFFVRAGALVNLRGKLARSDEDDTFLAPFRIASSESESGRELFVFLELPDVLASAELRGVLLEAFLEEADFNDAADQLNEALFKGAVTEMIIRDWCAPENKCAQVLRVDRKDKGRAEEYLLVLESFAGGTPVAVLIRGDDVVLKFEKGQWAVEHFGETDVIFAGLAEGATLKWNSFFGSPRAQLFADVLAILLRWRALL